MDMIFNVAMEYQLVERARKPVLSYRCSRWPPQPVIAKELDHSRGRTLLGDADTIRPWSLNSYQVPSSDDLMGELWLARDTGTGFDG